MPTAASTCNKTCQRINRMDQKFQLNRRISSGLIRHCTELRPKSTLEDALQFRIHIYSLRPKGTREVALQFCIHLYSLNVQKAHCRMLFSSAYTYTHLTSKGYVPWRCSLVLHTLLLTFFVKQGRIVIRSIGLNEILLFYIEN